MVVAHIQLLQPRYPLRHLPENHAPRHIQVLQRLHDSQFREIESQLVAGGPKPYQVIGFVQQLGRTTCDFVFREIDVVVEIGFRRLPIA